jgi:hypothetical protein
MPASNYASQGLMATATSKRIMKSAHLRTSSAASSTRLPASELPLVAALSTTSRSVAKPWAQGALLAAVALLPPSVAMPGEAAVPRPLLPLSSGVVGCVVPLPTALQTGNVSIITQQPGQKCDQCQQAASHNVQDKVHINEVVPLHTRTI